jgi:MFS family permease
MLMNPAETIPMLEPAGPVLAPPGEFRQGWRAVVGGAAGIATGTTGLPFFTLSLFILPLHKAFGWSVTEITGSALAKTVGTMVAFGFVGRLADRYGVRRVGLVSLALVMVSFLSFLFLTPSIWSFWLAWAVLSAVGAGTSPPIWTKGVSGWFDRNTGLAIGLVVLGTGISSALAPMIVAAGIARGGWQGGYWTLAAIAGLIGLPLVFAFFREAPSEVSQVRSGSGGALKGFTLTQALRHRAFWQIAVGLFFGGSVMAASVIHLLAILADRGLAAEGVTIISLMGVAVMVGRVGSGFLMDKMFAPFIAVGLFGIAAAAFAVLGIASVPAAIVIVCALAIGFVSGAEVNLLAYLTARYFGMKAYTEICNWLLVIFTIGCGFSPPIFGYVREHTGSYHGVLWGGAVILAATAVLFGTLGRYPDKVRAA